MNRGEIMNFIEFNEKFPNELSIIEYYIGMRYKDGAKCNHCGSNKVLHRQERPKVFQCNGCNNSFSIFKDSIFEKSCTDLIKWMYAIHLFLNSKKGISGYQLMREVQVTYKTAWRMLKQIREAMGNDSTKKQFEAIVEIDETYVGGKPRKSNYKDKDNDDHNKRGRGTKKTPVIGVVERNSKKVHAKVAKVNSKGQKLSGNQLLSVLDEICKKDAIVIIDEFKGYNKLKKTDYIHLKVDAVFVSSGGGGGNPGSPAGAKKPPEKKGHCKKVGGGLLVSWLVLLGSANFIQRLFLEARGTGLVGFQDSVTGETVKTEQMSPWLYNDPEKLIGSFGQISARIHKICEHKRLFCGKTNSDSLAITSRDIRIILEQDSGEIPDEIKKFLRGLADEDRGSHQYFIGKREKNDEWGQIHLDAWPYPVSLASISHDKAQSTPFLDSSQITGCDFWKLDITLRKNISAAETLSHNQRTFGGSAHCTAADNATFNYIKPYTWHRFFNGRIFHSRPNGREPSILIQRIDTGYFSLLLVVMNIIRTEMLTLILQNLKILGGSLFLARER